ncbi:hypothetical protein D9615_008083 [Tricholomella constricta]|uniref:Translation initiation factor 3 N-terminal domain-containing protein n=1 Tax=Tricholomella constricta TaxID=117010 RepID=A0A8H5GVP3_9AGAR|nr:hypothetical protein D9615_008083 [Tricholomella constricta]
MSSFIAFRSAALSLLRPRTHTTTCVHPFLSRGSKKLAASKTLPRDEAIEHPIVQLVDPTTGRLNEPTPLRTILASLDRRKQFVELVSLTPGPLVKIFSKSEVRQHAQEAAMKARVSARKNIHKEVQLTWSAAPGDLAHKLGKIRQELERGARVDLVFTRKKNQTPLSIPDMQARALEVVEELADVSKEWKEREVRANMTAIFLQGSGESEPVGRKRVVLHKGPKQKKQKEEDGQAMADIYQD